MGKPNPGSRNFISLRGTGKPVMPIERMNMNQKGFIHIVIAVVVVIIIAGAAGYFIVNQRLPLQKPAKEISIFDECVEAGYPVAGGIYPSQCVTPDGRRFSPIEEVKEFLSERLLTETGVVGVGIGQCNGEPCIQVMLEKGLENLPNLKDKIPSESHGFKVVTEVTGIICSQEAKVCPDGSTVGRTGPNCEFAPCP